MFQMECPDCSHVIKSPLLVELQSVDCSQCRKSVKVKDVVVSTKSFSIHRKDLLNRISLYKKLLGEVEKEMQSMNKEETVATQTKKSVDSFRAFLKDLLQGARDHYRLDMSHDFYVETSFDNKNRLARLINLSSKGAAIEFLERGQLPQRNAAIGLQLLLPGYAEPLSFQATVAWGSKPPEHSTTEPVKMGLQFKNLDEKTQACLWDFIMNAESSARI